MAGNAAASSGSSIQIQVAVQFTPANLSDSIDKLLSDIERQLKEAARNKTINIDLEKLKINKGSAMNAVNPQIQALRKQIGESLGKMGGVPVELKNMKIKVDKSTLDTVGKNIANDIVRSIEQQFSNLQLNLSSKNLNAKGMAQTLGQQIQQILKQTQGQAQKAQQQLNNQINPSTIFKKNNQVRANTSFTDYKNYMLQEAKAIKAAGKQVQDAINQVSKLTPNTPAYNQARSQAAQALRVYEDQVKQFQKRAKANAGAFKGEDLTAINQAVAQAGVQVATAKGKFDQLSASVAKVNTSAKEAANAIKLLQKAYAEAANAQKKFQDAMGKNLNSAQQKKLIQQGLQSQQLAKQYRDQYTQQYVNTGKTAGFSQQDKATVQGLVKSTDSSIKQGDAALSKYEKHIARVEKGFQDLRQKIIAAKDAYKSFADAGDTKAAQKIQELERYNKQIDAFVRTQRFNANELTAMQNKVQPYVNDSKLMTQNKNQTAKDIIDVAKQVKAAYTEVKKLQDQLNNTKPGTAAFNQLSQDLATASTNAQQLEAQLNSLLNSYSKMSTTMSTRMTSALNGATTAKSKAEAAAAGASPVDQQIIATQIQRLNDLKAAQASYNAEAEKLGKMQFGTQAYDAQLQKVQQLETKVEKIREKWQRAFDSGRLNTNLPIIQNIIAAFKELGVEIDSTRQKVQNVGPEAQQAMQKMKGLLDQVNNFRSQMTAQQQARSGALVDQFAGRLQSQINSGPTTDTALQAARAQLEWQKLSQSIANAGKESLTFGQNLKSAFSQFSGYFSVTIMVMEVVQQLRQMIQYTRELDTAMTELRKVTDASENTYSTFLDNASSKAVELGATLTDVVTATGDFARLGYNIDEALQLSEAAIKLKNVGDGITSISDASEKIISAMKGFQIPVDQVGSIIDKYNEVGNRFSISTSGIAEAMERSSAALASAGNSIDQSIALAVGRIAAQVYLSIGYREMYRFLTISVKGLKKSRPRKDSERRIRRDCHYLDW